MSNQEALAEITRIVKFELMTGIFAATSTQGCGTLHVTFSANRHRARVFVSGQQLLFALGATQPVDPSPDHEPDAFAMRTVASEILRYLERPIS
jgi:hypothetical protein